MNAKILGALALLLAVVTVAVPFNPARALTVSPARFEVSGNAGQTLAGEFLLINDQEEAKTFYSTSENFEARGESGTPNFVPGKDGLASWISVPREITLQKAEQKQVPFSIKIPSDAEPGGYFSAIFLSTQPPQAESGQVAVGAKVGILILLTVNGDIKEGGGITSLSLNEGRLATSLPVTFAYRFQNSGGDRVKPEGELVIRNLFGVPTERLQANEHEGNILPRSTRKFEVVWGPDSAKEDRPTGFFSAAKYQLQNFALGPYFAKVSLNHGTANTESSASYWFFVFPWQLSILLAIGLIILLFAIGKGIGAYNRWIISRAKNG